MSEGPRLAGAPIPRGVCEIPGQGAIRAAPAPFGLSLVGGLVPLALAASLGLRTVIHPHQGTPIERRAEVEAEAAAAA